MQQHDTRGASPEVKQLQAKHLATEAPDALSSHPLGRAPRKGHAGFSSRRRSPTLNRRHSGRMQQPRIHSTFFQILAAGSLFLGCTLPDLDQADIVAPIGNVSSAEVVPDRSQDTDLVRWSELPDSALWVALAAADSVAVVGIRQPGGRRGVFGATRLIDAATVRGFGVSLSQLPGVRLHSIDRVLPQVLIRLASQADLAVVRAAPYVDFVEPSRIDWRTFDSCGSEIPYTGSDNVQVATPGYNLGYDIAPLQYLRQNVDGAWAYTAGASHTVGLTDTGVDLTYGAAAEWSSTHFSSGMSSGRPAFVQTFPAGSPDCSHGSRSAGIIGAPRNGRSSVGVAYRAGRVYFQ